MSEVTSTVVWSEAIEKDLVKKVLAQAAPGEPVEQVGDDGRHAVESSRVVDKYVAEWARQKLNELPPLTSLAA